jgi:excisionase family DNA binding protein
MKGKANTKPSRTFTVREVADYFGVNASKVGKWIANGELKAVNIALSANGMRPRYRVTQASLDAFEAARSVCSPPCRAAASETPADSRQGVLLTKAARL